MKRTPEPELMDSPAQVTAYAEADFDEPNRLFVQILLASFPDLPAAGHAVDLGCGPADICIRLARELAGWRLTGVDAGANMLARAREAVAAAGLSERIRLERMHLPDPALASLHADAVLSNSLQHHLPDPMVLWHSIRAAGRAGAAVQVMDLSRPASEADARALVEEHAADAAEILRQDFFNSLRAAYTLDEVADQLRQAGLHDVLRVRAFTSRHWLVQGRLAA